MCAMSNQQNNYAEFLALFYYSSLHNSGIRKCTNGLSVRQCVHPSSYIPPLWMDGILRIWYHDQVPWAADASKIEFSSVPNLSNYGNFFHKV